jgi:prepilin-type N-terminal cleavage/methylation domain-containing protein
MLFKGKSSGFTLAELLISLAILGVIATFTIPKVLNSSTSSQNTAIAKEAASMISGAFSAYTLNNTLATTTTPGVLQQYMNYVSTDTSTTYSTGMVACSASIICLKLHSGAVLQYQVANTFGGTTTTDSIRFNLDPDGAGSQTAATFVQFYNGRLTTYGAATSQQTGGTALTPVASDPTYISSW